MKLRLILLFSLLFIEGGACTVCQYDLSGRLLQKHEIQHQAGTFLQQVDV